MSSVSIVLEFFHQLTLSVCHNLIISDYFNDNIINYLTYFVLLFSSLLIIRGKTMYI